MLSFLVAAKYRFGDKATPLFVNEKIKRALQNMSDEGKRDRKKGFRRGGLDAESSTGLSSYTSSD